MSNTKGRVLISQNTMEILELANQVYQKHLSDGENSLLKSLMNNKWDEIGPGYPKGAGFFLHPQLSVALRPAGFALKLQPIANTFKGEQP